MVSFTNFLKPLIILWMRLNTHEPWCLPDILRMDDFTVRVELKYDRNISEQRDIRYADDGNETDPHWPEDVPCLGRTQKG